MASAPLSVLILAWGCDGGPRVVSGWRRFQLAGGGAVVVGTVGVSPDPPLKWPRQRVGTREYPSEQGEYVLSRVVFIRKERHSLDASFS